MRAANRCLPGNDAHLLPDALDLRHFYLDSPLAIWAALKIMNRHRIAADEEQAMVRLAEPIVKRRHGYPETFRRIVSREISNGHAG